MSWCFRRLRVWIRNEWAPLAVATLLAVTIGLSPASERVDPKALAETARTRAQAQAVDVKPGTVSDPERVEALAKKGIARGRDALKELVQQQEAQHASKPDPTEAADSLESLPAQPVAGRLVVAVSSTMPEAMVREYVRQLDAIPEGVLVLRGFIEGARTVAPTGRWVERVRRREVNCSTCGHRAVQVVVDPLTYQSLGITQVPAVAYLPGVTELKHCDAETLSAAVVVYGAASVSSALKRLEREGVEIPAPLLKRLEQRI